MLGVAAAVAVVILGLAVFMPPAPPSPPQPYVEVKPDGSAYALYVKDNGKALREVWYSKNGGPLLMANGPIRAECGDRVEVVAVYADGSRQSTAAVVKCTKPLKAGLSSTQTTLVAWSVSSKLLDVVKETDPDAIRIKAYLSYCKPPEVYVTLIAETRYGSQQLPYKAYLRLDDPGCLTCEPRFATTFGTFPITVVATGGSITLNGIYSPRKYFNLTILHLPSFATVSDYMAGSPITIGIIKDVESGNVYVDIEGTRFYVGFCGASVSSMQKTVQELAELNATLGLRYLYYDNKTDKVYAAVLEAYRKPDGSYIFNVYHSPTPLRYNDVPEYYWMILSTRYGPIPSTVPFTMGAIVNPDNFVSGAIGILLQLWGIDVNSEAARELANFINWLDSLPEPQKGAAVNALTAGMLRNATDIVESNYGGSPYFFVNRNVEYVVHRVHVSSHVGTVTVRSVAVPGVFLGLVQGSTPFIVPDYVAILLANYTAIPTIASYR